MCGRFTHAYTWREIHDLLDLRWPERLEVQPRYNVAPTQLAPVVRIEERAGSGVRAMSMLRWGLAPSWSDDLSIGSRMINARSETAHEKPAFREAFRARRCIVPTSGFYEWREIPGRRTRQPSYIYPAEDRGVFLLAGLWEPWRDELECPGTFTILTTSPNEMIASFHDRMPVIIEPEAIGAWLGDGDQMGSASLDAARELLHPFPAERMRSHPVSTRVNTPGNDDPSLIEPVSERPLDDAGLFL